MSDDSDSDISMDKDSQGSSGSDDNDQGQDEEILQKDEEMKKKEIEDIKAFAIANGFDVEIEEEKKPQGYVFSKERLDAQ